MQAANDNGCAIGDNPVLRATLAHFAQHGLGAARQASRMAEDAFRIGDETAYRHWLAVCRTLDPRLAERTRRG